MDVRVPSEQPLVAVVSPEARHAELAQALLGDGLSLITCVASIDALQRTGASYDVAVLEADIRQVRSAALLRRLRERCGVLRIVLVRGDVDGHAVRRALEAGVDGMVATEVLATALGPTVRAVVAGQIAVPGAMRGAIAPPALSHRERQVLAHVVEGCTNSEIAARLYLAESTVKSHLATAFSKLGVRSRRDATAMILGADALSSMILPTAVPAPARDAMPAGRFRTHAVAR